MIVRQSFTEQRDFCFKKMFFGLLVLPSVIEPTSNILIIYRNIVANVTRFRIRCFFLLLSKVRSLCATRLGGCLVLSPESFISYSSGLHLFFLLFLFFAGLTQIID